MKAWTKYCVQIRRTDLIHYFDTPKGRKSEEDRRSPRSKDLKGYLRIPDKDLRFLPAVEIDSEAIYRAYVEADIESDADFHIAVSYSEQAEREEMKRRRAKPMFGHADMGAAASSSGAAPGKSEKGTKRDGDPPPAPPARDGVPSPETPPGERENDMLGEEKSSSTETFFHRLTKVCRSENWTPVEGEIDEAKPKAHRFSISCRGENPPRGEGCFGGGTRPEAEGVGEGQEQGPCR